MTEAAAAAWRAFDPAPPVAEARTPPPSWYLDPGFLELERRSVFHRHWIPVTRAALVAAPGAVQAGVHLGRPWLVVRDEDGRLRAFHNVCRHHASPVACGGEEVRELVCPYHGWTYALDGRLKRAPRLGRVEGFEPAAHGLRPLAVEERGPLVFLGFGAGLPSLDEALGPDAAGLWAPGAEGPLRHAATRVWDLRCNWKVFIDNYLDGGYHVAGLHPDLAAGLDLEGYRTTVGASSVLQECRARGDERLGAAARYLWVHPSWCANRYGPVLDLNLVEPLAVDRTRVVFEFFFEEGVLEDPDRGEAFVARAVAASEQVQEEDVAICEAVQTGLGSPAAAPGPYAPALEAGMHRFHCLVHADIGRLFEESEAAEG